MIATMNKGFLSVRNVIVMLSVRQHVDFIVAVPFPSKFAKDKVQGECKGIDTLSNTIVHSRNTLRAVTK